MKKRWMGRAVLCIVTPILVLAAQEGEKVPIRIEAAATNIAAANDGGQPPEFIIETAPGQEIALMFATNFESFQKNASTYFGIEEAGIEPTMLKADDSGKLVYTLPDKAFQAMAGDGGRIFFIALAIRPSGPEGYSVLGESFSIDGDPAEAPYVNVKESTTLRQAKQHFKAGEDHYDKDEFLEAVGEFEAALEFRPNPAFKYNIGVCYLQLAKKFLADYLDTGNLTEKQHKELNNILGRIQDFILEFNRRP